MAEVFTVLIEHSADAQVEVFTDRADAISFARQYAHEHGMPKYIKKRPVQGWEFFIEWGVDADYSARVERKTVDHHTAEVRRRLDAAVTARWSVWSGKLQAQGYGITEEPLAAGWEVAIETASNRIAIQGQGRNAARDLAMSLFSKPLEGARSE